MRIYTTGRQQGKTSYVVSWVKEGVKTDSYPFWDRVIVTISIREADRLRDEYNLDYNQVYAIQEWKNARIGSKPVHVAIDNADIILSGTINNGIVDVATFTQE